MTEGKGARAELRVDDLWIASDLPPAPARFTTVELGAEGMAVHFEGTARSRYQVSQSSDLKNWSADSESITDLDGKGSFHLNREPTRRASFIRLIGAEP